MDLLLYLKNLCAPTECFEVTHWCLQAIGRIVGLYPSTLLWPLLVLGLVLAVGIWGVTYVAKSEESSSRVSVL